MASHNRHPALPPNPLKVAHFRPINELAEAAFREFTRRGSNCSEQGHDHAPSAVVEVVQPPLLELDTNEMFGRLLAYVAARVSPHGGLNV